MHIFDDPTLVTSRHQFFLALAISVAVTYSPFVIGLPVYIYTVWRKKKPRSTAETKLDEKKHVQPPKRNAFSVLQKGSTSGKVAPNTTVAEEKKRFSVSGLFKRKNRQKNTENTRTTHVV
jgi:hypothetical protein